ncbi:MAG: UbiH/UbiF/VisC/COQ6 family ubiquinone biosynthesis hydroxylase [Pseudomonadales bacterium]|jgi:2-octaprenylphenol hydroxylase|tara:strand:- start:3 stop:1253 length:1251 start_codon:yes stop_codon:yes gene_type:complete
MSNAQPKEFDVVIAGAGMVGASLACLLAESSLSIALVDRKRLVQGKDSDSPKLHSDKFDPRVSAISQASQQLFRQLGVWEDMNAVRVCNYNAMQVWDAEGTGSIDFSAEQINQPELGSIVENSIIIAALHKRIAQLENVFPITPFSIESFEQVEREDGLIVKLNADDGQGICAPLIIAADGANSKLRALANFECREWDYEQHALVTTVRTQLPHNNTALQRFMETGPLAFLPLRSATEDDTQHFCSIVWSMLPDQAERVMSLSEDEFNSELAAALESKLGAIEWSDKRFVFPLRQRHALDYVKESIVLVGDAAHTIHPLAGQGVNLGLLDAKALAEELQRGIEAGRSVADPKVLLRYQRRRKGNNLSMMWLMEGFKRLFGQQDLSIRWLRNIGMNAVDKMTPIKNQLIRKAMGLDS